MTKRFSENYGTVRLCLILALIFILIGTTVFEYYQNQRTRQLPEQQSQQAAVNLPLCQIPSMRVYHEPGYHQQNGTFVFSKNYDTIVIWTLIECNADVNNSYNFVGVFKLLPVGFVGLIAAEYIPEAFTVYPGNATYEQRILLYLPFLGGNETRDLTIQLIILAYTGGSATIAGMKSVDVTETG